MSEIRILIGIRRSAAAEELEVLRGVDLVPSSGRDEDGIAGMDFRFPPSISMTPEPWRM